MHGYNLWLAPGANESRAKKENRSMKLSRTVCRLFFAFMILATVGVRAAPAATITLSVMGEEPAEDMRKILPLASYLNKQLSADGTTQGKVIVAKTLSEIATMLRGGKIDLHFDSYARTLALSRLAGSKPILRRWKRGVAEYYGVIFARSDSGINRLEDLHGKNIALEEEFSTVGQLLPKFMITEKGLKLVPTDARITQDSVGYTYAYWDENTMLWVLKGKVAAGAMDSQTYAELGQKHGDILKVLAKTPPVPRHVVSIRPGMPQDLLANVKEILIHMDQTEDGKKALQQFDRTAKFDELSEHNTGLIQKLGKLIEAEMKLQ
jgi:phosphonate transport system substrate-binding protein